MYDNLEEGRVIHKVFGVSVTSLLHCTWNIALQVERSLEQEARNKSSTSVCVKICNVKRFCLWFFIFSSGVLKLYLGGDRNLQFGVMFFCQSRGLASDRICT